MFGQRMIPIPFKFIISGSIAALVSFISLYVLTEYAGIWYLASSVISFFLSFAFSFTIQKYWTFENKSSAEIPYQMSLHLSIAGFNLFLNTFLVYALVEYADFWYILAQFIASAVIAVESFILLKWVYKIER